MTATAPAKKSEDEKEDTLFESVLESVGSCGRYQQLLLWAFLAPLDFMVAWVALVPILLVDSPDHWCLVPGKPEDLDLLQWRNLTIPRKEDGSFSQCTQYNISNISDWILYPDNSTPIVPCQMGYLYSKDNFDETLTTRQDWVCDNSAKVAMWQSVGLAGNVVGTLFLNPLSDLFGRRLMFLVSAAIFGVMGIVRVYVTSEWLLMTTQFLANTSFPPILEISLILAYELVSSTWRSRVTSISYMFWSAGTCVLALLAWLSRSHRILSIIISTPFLLYLPAALLIPESPRWLLTRGRVDEAHALLARVARVNGRDVPPKLHDQLSEISKKRMPNHGAYQLLQTPVLRRRTILLTFCYVLNNIFFYGLAYNTSNLNGNLFMNFFLIGVTEMPANAAGWWASLSLGRRLSQSLCFLLAACCAAATIFTEHSPVWASIMLLTMSKFFITMSFLVVYLLIGELYPTSHCGTGMGLASMFASSIGTASPYIAYSAKEWYGLPFIILMLLGLTGCVLSSFLPETLNAPVPQNLLEAETHLTDSKYFSYKGRKFWQLGGPRVSDAQHEAGDAVRRNSAEGYANPVLSAD
ncbi:carcinine transporter [Hyalella azteca]|uniref:Carcinine transporter n=1 Tax=Hyalella azteca TaxID=294128 RepID=A0A8B7PM41_HYAAZ|nr:carcinine transporter [Hyalella azteca]